MSRTAKFNGAKIVQDLRQATSDSIKSNPWFKRCARYLALNSKTNVQKSYWKLKYNVLSSGQITNANTLIKLIKLTSVLSRHVEMNKWKSFYSILHHGRSEFDSLDVSKMFHERMDRSEIRADRSEILSSPYRETYDLEGLSRITATEYEYPSSQSAGLKILEKLVKKKLEGSVKKWQNNTMV